MQDVTPPPHDRPVEPGGNLAWYAGRRRLALTAALAILSGLLLSAAFPPLELDRLAWVALVPILLAPPPAGWGRRLAAGYLLGLAHYLTSLAWLNTIGFAAGTLLALVCAAFPALWYLGGEAFADTLAGRRPAARPDGRLNRPRPAAVLALDGWRLALYILFVPALWVGLEWLRGWVFTGFPWNQLGVSQWQRLGLLRLTQWTGVYGISGALVLVSVTVARLGGVAVQSFRTGIRRPFPWPVVPGLILLVPVAGLAVRPSRLPPPARTLRIAAVQGNLPQCRDYRPEQLDEALRVYAQLTRAAAAGKPDLIVWPETAVPAALLFDETYARVFADLVRDTHTPMLFGTLHYQPAPEAGPDTPPQVFNSVFLSDSDGRIVEAYHKIHRVPFGEYVPFGRYLPWLVDLIGMGRDLTPGSDYTLFRLPADTLAGVNICFEDAFPDISRQFVRRGAGLLLTLTNDAWYAESSGPRQHMIHAVLRAVENRRPLLRSGNNSDTGLILPDGEVRGLLADPVTGHRFVRGCRTYEVPVWDDPGTTFYTRHGDVFAESATALAGAGLAAAVVRALRHKRRLRDLAAATPAG